MKKMNLFCATLFFCAVSFAVFVLLPGTAQAETKKSILFPNGYCTYYVADNNSKYVAYIMFQNCGNGRCNAINWIEKAKEVGYKTKDKNWKPKKYSVVVFGTQGYGAQGHVALVTKVESKRFQIAEMNYNGWNKETTARWIDKGHSSIKGFILTKKAVEQYEDDDKGTYKELKKQYKKHDIWYDGKKQ